MAPGVARQRRAASDVGLAQSGLGLGAFGGSDRELAKFAYVVFSQRRWLGFNWEWSQMCFLLLLHCTLFLKHIIECKSCKVG